MALASLYKDISHELCIDFLDASKIVQINTIDGIHWDATQHNDFALALCDKIRTIYDS